MFRYLRANETSLHCTIQTRLSALFLMFSALTGTVFDQYEVILTLMSIPIVHFISESMHHGYSYSTKGTIFLW